MCLPVKFEHLWKIAAPVGVVDGFDLGDFDVLCQVNGFPDFFLDGREDQGVLFWNSYFILVFRRLVR